MRSNFVTCYALKKELLKCSSIECSTMQSQDTGSPYFAHIWIFSFVILLQLSSPTAVSGFHWSPPLSSHLIDEIFIRSDAAEQTRVIAARGRRSNLLRRRDSIAHMSRTLIPFKVKGTMSRAELRTNRFPRNIAFPLIRQRSLSRIRFVVFA